MQRSAFPTVQHVLRLPLSPAETHPLRFEQLRSSLCFRNPVSLAVFSSCLVVKNLFLLYCYQWSPRSITSQRCCWGSCCRYRSITVDFVVI